MFSNSKALKEAHSKIEELEAELDRVSCLFDNLAWAPTANWEKEDAENLKLFMNSGSGERFQMVLRNAVLFKQQAAINKMDSKESARALGFRETVHYIDSLQQQEFHEDNPSMDVDYDLESIHP